MERESKIFWLCYNGKTLAAKNMQQVDRSKYFFFLSYIIFKTVFSVNLVCKKELNLMLKVSETSNQGAVGFDHRGTDYFLPRLFFHTIYLFIRREKSR